MKVCFFIANLGDGGAQRQCIALINALQEHSKAELHLILLGWGEHEDSLDASRLQIHRTNVSNFGSPKALPFVIRTLRRVRPDILISWLHPADIWSYAATRLVRGVPWIITERGSALAYSDRGIYDLRKCFGCRGAAAIIANSEPGKKLWDSLAPRSPVHVIPNILLEPGSSTNVDRTESVHCLYVGRIEPQKNVGSMTAAFAAFGSTHPQARLVIVGRGADADEVGRIATEGGVEQQVELVGFRKDVPMLMSGARLLLSFSRHEGMPNVVMEAAAAGLTAVVSDIPEHRALLGNDYPYYVCLDKPSEDAAAVIARAWADGPSTAEDSYAYAREVLTTMTPGKVATAYLDAFTEVIARSGGRVAHRDA